MRVVHSVREMMEALGELIERDEWAEFDAWLQAAIEAEPIVDVDAEWEELEAEMDAYTGKVGV